MQRPLQWFCEDLPSEASKLLALQQYWTLDKIRSAGKLERLRKFWTDGTYNYDFQLGPQGDRVRVWGGSTPFIGPLVFVTPLNDQDIADVWFYYYLDPDGGTWEKVCSVDRTGNVVSSYIGSVNISDGNLSFAKRAGDTYATKDPSFIDLSISEPDLTYSIAWYESALSILFDTQNKLYVQNVNYPDGAISATFPSSIPRNNMKLTTMKKLLYAYTTGEQTGISYGDFSGFGGVVAWLIPLNPAGVASGAIETWTWRSRFYMDITQVPKMYYGGPYFSGTSYGPLYANGPEYINAEIMVKFACLVDDKTARPANPTDPDFPEWTPPVGIQGFCEVLQKISGSYPNEIGETDDGDYNLAYFIDSMWQGEKQSDLYYAPPYQTLWLIEHGGIPPEHLFEIDYSSRFGSGEDSAPEIYWWAGNWTPVVGEGPSWAPPTSPLQGVFAWRGTDWVLHRYFGNPIEVLSGTNYIKHEISSDGNIICIMQGTTTITHIIVYDLNRGVILQDIDTNLEYTSGAFVPNLARQLLTYKVAPVNPPVEINFDLLPDGRAVTTPIVCHFTSSYGIYSPYDSPEARVYKSFCIGNKGYGRNYDLTEASGTEVSIGHLRRDTETPAGNGPFSATIFGHTYFSETWEGFCTQFPYVIAYGTGNGIYSELYYAVWSYSGASSNIFYPTGGLATNLVGMVDDGFAIEG